MEEYEYKCSICGETYQTRTAVGHPYVCSECLPDLMTRTTCAAQERSEPVLTKAEHQLTIYLHCHGWAVSQIAKQIQLGIFNGQKQAIRKEVTRVLNGDEE